MCVPSHKNYGIRRKCYSWEICLILFLKDYAYFLLTARCRHNSSSFLWIHQLSRESNGTDQWSWKGSGKWHVEFDALYWTSAPTIRKRTSFNGGMSHHQACNSINSPWHLTLKLYLFIFLVQLLLKKLYVRRMAADLGISKIYASGKMVIMNTDMSMKVFKLMTQSMTSDIHRNCLIYTGNEIKVCHETH